MSTTESIHNVLLIGAGGNLGPSILKALDTDPQFTVSVLARQSSTSTCPSHIKVYRIPDSYPEDDLSVAFQGQDAVVCSLNPGNIIQQLKFIDAAVEAGVKWFVPAEFGGNKEAAQHGEKMPLHEAKELVNARLVEAEKSGLSWTAVATGPFIDWAISNGFLGFDLKARRAKIYDTGNERWTGTRVSTIGLAVARVLRKPDEFKNKFIYIYSASTTQNETLSALESATSSKWEIDHVKMVDEKAIGRKKLDSGDWSGAVPLILSYFYQEGMGADYARDVEAANGILGLPAETVEDIVRDVINS